jgi:hypothetical protein
MQEAEIGGSQCETLSQKTSWAWRWVPIIPDTQKSEIQRLALEKNKSPYLKHKVKQ